MPTYSAAQALGLRPLDRVQVYDREVRAELRYDMQRGRGMTPPPFWYFMFITDEGQLAVSSPAGSVNYLDPTDVLDVRPSKDGPIAVKAITDKAHLAWLKLDPKQQQHARPIYSDAHVVGAFRNRWGQLDYYVRFLDPSLNHRQDGTRRFAPVADGDRRQLAKVVRRTRMPVRADRGGNWSADQGLVAAETTVRYQFRSFLDAALSGDDARARSIALGCRYP